LLKDLSNLALNTAREGAATALIGDLCQGLTTLIVKNFFLISNLKLPSFSLKPLSLVLSLHALVNTRYMYYNTIYNKNMERLPDDVFP